MPDTRPNAYRPAPDAKTRHTKAFTTQFVGVMLALAAVNALAAVLFGPILAAVVSLLATLAAGWLLVRWLFEHVDDLVAARVDHRDQGCFDRPIDSSGSSSVM